jgi:hypothetical protein
MTIREFRILFWGAFAGSLGAAGAGASDAGDHARVVLASFNFALAILFIGLERQNRADKSKGSKP